MWIAQFFDHIKVLAIFGLLKRFLPLDSVFIWMLPKKMRERGMKFGEFHAARIAKRLAWNTPRLDL